MKAYLVNGTEIYAANDMPEAMDMHCSMTNDNHGSIESVEALDNSYPWKDEVKTDETTIGHVLAKVQACPAYLGSTEV